MVSVRSLAASVFALALLAIPASAATFNGTATLTRINDLNTYTFTPTGVDLTGTVDNPVQQFTTYESNVVRSDAETFTDTVFFNFNPIMPSLLSATNLVISGRGFTSLVAQWFGPAGPALNTYDVLLAGGSIVNQGLSLIQGAGVYKLVITGTSKTVGGTYVADVQTGEGVGPPTPLPGTAFLFGSVLAGGVGGLQLMRRRRSVRAG